MKEKQIEFRQVSFTYDAQAEPTLEGIDLTIYAGEKLLIVGPSGSGKSTLGQLINGIIPHIHKGTLTGEFLIKGQPAFQSSIYERSHQVSTVLQDTDGQFIGLSVAEDMAFALENDMVDLPSMKEQVSTWAQRLDLTDLLTHRPQDLSGGQKQRVSLAGVLIDKSPILLFDEPLANLDPKTGKDTIQLIKNLQKETQATVVIIEHRLEEALALEVDRVVLINEGRILFDGPPNHLLASELLTKNGIREPLYLSLLKDLGYDLSLQTDLTDLDKMDVASFFLEGEGVPNTSIESSPLSLLHVDNLNFAYSERHILKDISFDLYAGQKVAIVGKNGAGKSTLAKALCQFISSSGKISWKGEDVSADSIKERAEKIGYVLQNPNQMISQTMIFDEVALGLRLRGMAEEEVRKRVHDTLKICGLYPMRTWPISALSFGQKKRVTIASILVLGVEMILLDEPTAGQDYRHYTEMMTFLDHLAELGHAIVMITHDMQLMLEYSERCLVLLDGQIIADLPPIEVLSDKALIEKAHLRETSLFQLAEKVGADSRVLSYAYQKERRRNGC